MSQDARLEPAPPRLRWYINGDIHTEGYGVDELGKLSFTYDLKSMLKRYETGKAFLRPAVIAEPLDFEALMQQISECLDDSEAGHKCMDGSGNLDFEVDKEDALKRIRAVLEKL